MDQQLLRLENEINERNFFTVLEKKKLFETLGENSKTTTFITDISNILIRRSSDYVKDKKKLFKRILMLDEGLQIIFPCR